MSYYAQESLNSVQSGLETRWEQEDVIPLAIVQKQEILVMNVIDKRFSFIILCNTSDPFIKYCKATNNSIILRYH